MPAINLAEKLASFSTQWTPKIIADYNGNDVMVVKIKGEFVWHSHPDTDDFFMVLKGQIKIEMKEGDVILNEGEMFVVPAGVEHRPVAQNEAHLLLIEPNNTPNTGNPETAVEKPRI